MKRVQVLHDQVVVPQLPIRFSDEVAAALRSAPTPPVSAFDSSPGNSSKLGSGRPVGFARIVALESTIISHGMPYPANVACAKDLQDIVRREGAVPATIAILNGVIHVGLSDEQLDLLGRLGRSCAKVSRRDLPFILSQHKNGATTVSGTILIAQMVGIDIMATGGIGGVHRNGESSMDVSADLQELGHTKVLVVCAGVKSILDIPRTLEYLETQGVSVFGYQTDEFPAFFTPKSGSKAPNVLHTPSQAAQYLVALRQLKYRGGGILAVPIPEDQAAQGEEIEQAIQKSLKELAAQDVRGRDITPFVLARVNELTQGRSLKSNIALVKNNTKVAAQIAVAYHKTLLA
jgi:pseudouridine-5'-phosphate glycosidase